MSIYSRSSTPPPREPSPEPIYLPLNPPRRNNQRAKKLPRNARSCDNIGHRSEQHKCLLNKLDGLSKSPTRSSFPTSPADSPLVTPAQSPPLSPKLAKKSLHRSVSFVNPQTEFYPPPVPPIPESVLAPTDRKPILLQPPLVQVPTITTESSESAVSSARKEAKSRWRPRFDTDGGFGGFGCAGLTCTRRRLFSLRSTNHGSVHACSVA